MKDKTTNFIERARIIHGDKYDYSKAEYVNCDTKVCIICPIHGEFWQTPHIHLRGKGCPKCGGSAKMSTNEFIEKAKKLYGDKYDYSRVEYKNNHTKVCIICPIHGEFWMTPNDFLDKHECPRCAHERGGKKIRLTKEDFIKKVNEIHNNKYDYSKAEYVNYETKICIICPKHGEFWQTPHAHLNGKGCRKCAIEKQIKRNSLTTEQFIEKAKVKHGDKYDYSKVEYINGKTKVCIICPQHGEFWQRAEDHLYGHGCSLCNDSHIETEVLLILESLKLNYEHNKFYDFLDGLQLDFYIPELKIAIECQGIQHFRTNDYFGGVDAFKSQQERDEKKRLLCETNGITLLYYTNDKHKTPINVIKHKEKLINKINKCKEKIMINT